MTKKKSTKPLIHILTEDVQYIFSRGYYTGCRIPWDMENRKLKPGLIVTHDLSVVTCEKCIKRAKKILKEMKEDEEIWEEVS